MAVGWVVALWVFAGLVLLIVIFVACGIAIREILKRTRDRRPLRTTSRVYPRVSSPIYAISHNSIDKFSTSKKRHSSAFSGKSNYYDSTTSPQVAHKEYLDFDNTVFDEQRRPDSNHSQEELEPAESFYSLPPHPPRHINVAQLERPFGSPNPVNFEPVRETYRDQHITYKRPDQRD